MIDKGILAAVAVGLLIMLILSVSLLRRRKPGKLNVEYFRDKWQSLQKQCVDKSTWPLAIIDADKLLDEALKKGHYHGKTMGERLVSAQHDIKDNDGVWYGHKLRNRLVHENDVKLKERDVKDALFGIRSALQDLGALK
ncbi:MAG: hypothetical protein WC498_01325 [Candidatus Saccharimonadales bacterium]